MTFNVLCQSPNLNYTYTTTRTGNNGELEINLVSSVMHLGQPYGFRCDKVNFQDAWALQATRVYDKQLQILLHKFKEYRQNLQPISNYSRTVVQPDKPQSEIDSNAQKIPARSKEENEAADGRGTEALLSFCGVVARRSAPALPCPRER